MLQILLSRSTILPLLSIPLAAMGWTLAIGQSASRGVRSPMESVEQPVNSRRDAALDSNKLSPLVREGTHLRDRHGHFEFTGDSAVFVDDEGARFGGLKNLSMQRVVETLRPARFPEDLAWTVSGVVTEFGGRNYLLITRVVRRSSVPDQTGRGRRRGARPEGRGGTVVDIGEPLSTMGSTGR